MTELVKIKEDADQFTVDYVNDAGVPCSETFYIELDGLSVQRYRMFELLRVDVMTGKSNMTHIQTYQSILDNCNKMALGGKVLVDIVVETTNALNYAQNLEQKYGPVMWLCALFINTKDEDRRYFNREVMARKIQIWEDGGVDSGGFTMLAAERCGLPAGFLSIGTPIYSDKTVPDWQTIPEGEPDPNPLPDTPMSKNGI